MALYQNWIPPPKPGGRHRALDMRAVVNAIFYVVAGGITWRMLPHEYPRWPSVYWYCSQWRDSGDWQRLHDTLRAQVRQQAGHFMTRALDLPDGVQVDRDGTLYGTELGSMQTWLLP